MRQDPPWPTVLLIVGAGIVSAFQVGKAPMALAAVQADLAMGIASASWLLSAFAVVGALAGIAIGIAVDHLGARRTAVGGLLLQGLCSALGAFAEGAAWLLATRLVEGVGFLAVAVAAPTLIVAVTRPDAWSRAIAVWGTFMPLGMALVMLAAPLLTEYGWRGLWLANAAVLFAYACLLALGTPPASPAQAPRRPVAEDVRQTLAAAGPWLLAGLMAVFAAAFFAVFGFLPSILAERLSVTLETASLMTAAAVASNVLGNLACGRLLACGVPRTHLLLIGFATMALCGFGILGDGPDGRIAYALCLAFSAVGGLVPVAILEGAARHAPHPELVGATVGSIMQGNNVGLVLGPALAGALVAAFGWASVSLLVAALAVAAGLLVSRLRRRSGEGYAPAVDDDPGRAPVGGQAGASRRRGPA